MIVSVDTRLAAMLSGLTGAVLPSLGADAFVTEQAQLVVGHLQVLRAQSEYSEEYERLEHRYLRGLAADLVADARGGSRTTESADLVGELLGKGVPERIGALREAQARLGDAVADLLAAEGTDGTDACVAGSTRIVVAAEYAQSLRDRSFHAAFGYEDGSVPIVPIDRMMDEFRAAFPAEEVM